MHFKFVLNEDFWIREISRKKAQAKINEQDIQFLFLALEDGHIETVLTMVAEILSKELKKNRENLGNIRVNYLIAKMQNLISMYGRVKNLYPLLREHYKEVDNVKKVRETYWREIRFGYDTHDIVYDEYTTWEQDESML